MRDIVLLFTKTHFVSILVSPFFACKFLLMSFLNSTVQSVFRMKSKKIDQNFIVDLFFPVIFGRSAHLERLWQESSLPTR